MLVGKGVASCLGEVEPGGGELRLIGYGFDLQSEHQQTSTMAF